MQRPGVKGGGGGVLPTVEGEREGPHPGVIFAVRKRQEASGPPRP